MKLEKKFSEKAEKKSGDEIGRKNCQWNGKKNFPRKWKEIWRWNGEEKDVNETASLRKYRRNGNIPDTMVSLDFYSGSWSKYWLKMKQSVSTNPYEIKVSNTIKTFTL